MSVWDHQRLNYQQKRSGTCLCGLYQQEAELSGCVRELPTGRGFADFVYIPKPEYKADYPALVVELKWNKTADTALQQIKDRKYPQSLEPYIGNILLVGINYDKKTKEHSCVIENDKKQ